MKSVATSVQYLHADLAAFRVHGIGEQSMPANFPRPGQLSCEWLHPTADVRGDPTGDDESNAALRTLRKVGGELGKVCCAVFQASMHGAHEDAIA